MPQRDRHSYVLHGQFSAQVVLWADVCPPLAAGETQIGALRAGKDARAKLRSSWHMGLKPTKSLKKQIEVEAKASVDP